MTTPTTNDTRDVGYAVARRLGEIERTPLFQIVTGDVGQLFL